MVVESPVNWDAVLLEREQALLAKQPEQQRIVQARRRHVDFFHKTVWPEIREKLRREHRIELTENEEPHWIEPWKAAYWHPSTDLRDRTTWILTGPISADAASIDQYLAKGWRFRRPEPVPSPEVAPEIHTPLSAIGPPSKQSLCRKCGRGFATKAGLHIHQARYCRAKNR